MRKYDQAFKREAIRKIHDGQSVGGVFESISQARGEIFTYIEGYYNRERRHSA